jgi:hypothetical protein
MSEIINKSHLITDGNKLAKGYKHFKKMWAGNKLAPKEAIEAFCFECMGGYADGIADCQCYDCPLYDHHYYRNNMYLSKRKTDLNNKVTEAA